MPQIDNYLNAYVAIDRQLSISKSLPLPDRTTGTALFADISGFTQLTSTLAREMGAQRGPEELNDQINRVFTALIDAVRQYHGCVVVFGGDAITCWFDGDDGSLGTACALAMQAAMQQFDNVQISSASSVSMHLKVAVVCGEVRRFVVGDREIQLIDVLAGRLLERLVAAEQLVEKGEVIVGDEIAQLFGDQLVVVEKRDAESYKNFAVVESLKVAVPMQPWPPAPVLDQELVREWLHKPVYQRLNDTSGQYLAELRPVTPLFISFSGIDYDNDSRAREKLDSVICWLQNIAKRYEGCLVALNIGDKGSYCQLAFGALVLHEDDTLRAIAAAQDMLSATTDLIFLRDLKIGISRGIVHAGAYGGSDRSTYGINGADVNLCARLMGKALEGQILVTPAVAKIAESSFQFQPLEQTQLKGFTKPITLYSLIINTSGTVAPALVTRDATPLVGRFTEKKQLTDALSALEQRHSAIIQVEGDAGIGKSRLLSDFIQLHNDKQVRCLIGSGNAIEVTTAYHAWRPVFRALFAEDILLEAESIDAVVESILGKDTDLKPLAPLLNVVLPLAIPETDLTREMTGSLRASNIQALLLGLLQKAADKLPLLIVVEDAHWIDSASWSLLSTVSEQIKPLLLIVASRAMATPPRELEQLKLANNFSLISLDNMDRKTIEGIICNRLQVAQLPEAMANFIHEKASGNPFFSEELAFALRDNGIVAVTDGKLEIKHQGNMDLIDFPDTIQGVIISRIDQLPATSQLSLKIASIIGRLFSMSVLSGIHPSEITQDTIKAQLDTLVEVDLVRIGAIDPEMSYLFKHIITQEVAYNLLTFSQRRSLHREAAELYEAQNLDESIRDYPLLSHHWTHAEINDKAIENLDKAGAQALRRGAFREAIQFIDKSYVLSQQHGIHNEPLVLARRKGDLGIANLKIGNLEGSRQNLEASLQHLNRPLPDNVEGIKKGLKRQTQRQFLHRILPFVFMGSVKDEQTKQESLVAAQAYEHLGQLFYHANDPLSNLYTSVNVLNLAEQVGPSPQLTRAYGQMTLTTSIMNRKRLSKIYSRLATKSMRDDTPHTDKAMTNEFVAIAWAGVGRWTEANALSVEAMNLSERIGDNRRWNENISMNALTRYPTGDAAESLRLREQLLEAGRRDNDIQIQGWGLLEQAEVAIHQLRFQDSLALLKTAAELGPVIGRPEEVWLHGMVGVVNSNLNLPEQAKASAMEAFNRLSKAPPTAFYTMEGYSGVVEVFSERYKNSRNSADIEQASEALHHLKRFANVFTCAEPRCLLWEGVLQWQSDQQDQAMSTWQNGLEKANKMSMVYEAGLLQCELANYAKDEKSRLSFLRNAETALSKYSASGRLPKI